MYPDGPLQYPQMFHEGDKDAERDLLRCVWGHLRRGDLNEAMHVCCEKGQPWRAACLQGMLSHNPSKQEFTNRWDYEDFDNDWVYEMDKLKEVHTDWSEMFYVESGNPWRRLWKETCLDIAQSPTRMPDYEVAIMGYCSGFYPAMAPMCPHGLEKAWANIHCLKEALVEKLLDENRIATGGKGMDESMGDAECVRLHGVYANASVEELDAITFREMRRIFQDMEEVGPPAVVCFRKVQVLIIHSVWDPSYSGQTLDYLKSWMSESDDVHHLVKQFAAYFAAFQKEGLPYSEHVAKEPIMDVRRGEGDGQDFMQHLFADSDVDFLVKEHVTDLVNNSAMGVTADRIAEFLSVLTKETLVEVYSWFLRSLVHPRGGTEEEQSATITQSVALLWELFPFQCLSVLSTFSTQIMQSAWAAFLAEKKPRTEELFHALFVLTELWWVISNLVDQAENSTLQNLIKGFGLEPAENLHNQAQQALEHVFVPISVDLLVTTMVMSESTLELSQKLDEWSNNTFWKNLRSEHSDNLLGIWFLRTEIPWYLRFFTNYMTWASTLAGQQTLMSEAELRESVLELAIPFIEHESFLVQLPTSKLSEDQWKSATSILASRLLGALEHVHTETEMLSSALSQLTIAVANSSWMLPYIGRQRAGEFLTALQRMATEPRRIK